MIDNERVFAQLQADGADTRFAAAIRGPVGRRDSRNERLWNAPDEIRHASAMTGLVSADINARVLMMTEKAADLIQRHPRARFAAADRYFDASD